MDNNNWLLIIVGLCVFSVWPINRYFRGRRKYLIYIYMNDTWHTCYLRNKDEAHIIGQKLAKRAGGKQYIIKEH